MDVKEMKVQWLSWQTHHETSRQRQDLLSVQGKKNIILNLIQNH